jgi:hypothetical protein
MKKLKLFTLASLALAGAAELSAATWNIQNQLDKELCITVNTAVSQIRRHLEAGESVKVSSKACLYSISVKEGAGHRQEASGKARCPKGLPNIAKATITQIDKAAFDTLKGTGAKAVMSAQDEAKRKAALSEAGKAIFGVISKACSSRDFIIADVNGEIKVLTK